MNELQQAIKYRQAGEYEKAREILAALHAQQPDNAEINYQFAWLHDAMGDETGAVPYYEQAISLGLPPEDLRGALLGLGSTYRTIGQYDKSIATLQRGMETFPDAKEFPAFLAMALYNTGQHKDAVSLLLKTLVDTSNDPGIQRFQRAIRFYAENLDQVWI